MSNLLRLNQFDFIKGAVVSITVAILTYLQQSFTEGGVVSLKVILSTSITALIAYLIKQLATDNSGQILSMVGSRRRRKKKPKNVMNGQFTFDGLDIVQTDVMYAFSDMMNDIQVTIGTISNGVNEQTITFVELIEYTSFESIEFEIEIQD